MANEFIGILDKKLEKKTGQGKNGEWQSMDFVCKTVEQFPEMVVFNCFNNTDLIENQPIGTQIKVHFNFKAKEYQGKYYNALQVWKIENLSKVATQQPKKETIKTEVITPEVIEDDLPF